MIPEAKKKKKENSRIRFTEQLWITAFIDFISIAQPTMYNKKHNATIVHQQYAIGALATRFGSLTSWVPQFFAALPRKASISFFVPPTLFRKG